MVHEVRFEVERGGDEIGWLEDLVELAWAPTDP
jgi:hypothetical protein